MTSRHAVPHPLIDMLFAVSGSDAELVNEKLSKSEGILLCKVSNTLTETFLLLKSIPSAKPTVGPGTPRRPCSGTESVLAQWSRKAGFAILRQSSCFPGSVKRLPQVG